MPDLLPALLLFVACLLAVDEDRRNGSINRTLTVFALFCAASLVVMALLK